MSSDADTRYPPGVLAAVAAVTAFGTVAVLAFGIWRGAYRDESSQLAPVAGATSAVPRPTPSGPRHVDVRVGSVDLPGCFPQSEPFAVYITSRWGSLESFNMMRFYWEPHADAARAIQIRMEGAPLRRRMDPGDLAPEVRLNLNLDTPAHVNLVLFRFERRDERGRACFRHERPADEPRLIEPIRPQDA